MHSAEQKGSSNKAQHAHPCNSVIRVVLLHRVYHHCQFSREAVHRSMGQCGWWWRRWSLRWRWQVYFPLLPYDIVGIWGSMLDSSSVRNVLVPAASQS